MRVTVTDFDDWSVEEQVDTGVPPFKMASVTVRPTLTRHCEVLVTGADWLPINKEGEAALLVHSPEAYFEKQNLGMHSDPQSLRQTPDGVIATTGRVRELPGTSVLVGGHPNYYHWLVEHLPKLLMARRLMKSLPRILINRPRPFQIESLRLLGIDEWEEVAPDESVMCEDLWIPTGLARSTVAHPEVPRLLREAFPPTEQLTRRKVYISRRDATSRSLVNEVELIAELTGFETHVTGEMGFQQQVNLFASVDAFIAVHGAGMANAVFCRPGSTVYEIFTPLQKVTSMWFLAKVSGLNHEFVPARNVTVGADGRPLLGTLKVDIEAVRRVVA